MAVYIRLKNLKPEFLYTIIFIIDQIKHMYQFVMAFRMLNVELNKHISYIKQKKKKRKILCHI